MNRISKFFKLIATGSMSLVLSACYGVMVDPEPIHTKKIRVETLDGDGKGIPNLQISFRSLDNSIPSEWLQVETTNNEGIAGFDIPLDYEDSLWIKVEDIDGAENGSYQEQIQLCEGSVATITMEKK